MPVNIVHEGHIGFDKTEGFKVTSCHLYRSFMLINVVISSCMKIEVFDELPHHTRWYHSTLTFRLVIYLHNFNNSLTISTKRYKVWVSVVSRRRKRSFFSVPFLSSHPLLLPLRNNKRRKREDQRDIFISRDCLLDQLHRTTRTIYKWCSPCQVAVRR